MAFLIWMITRHMQGKRSFAPLKNFVVFSVAMLLMNMFALCDAFATNGAKLIAPGPIAAVMGGTGCVEPQDTAAMMINPAGVTKIGKRIDIAMEVPFIDLKMDTSKASSALFRNTNIDGYIKSNKDFLVLPQLGASGRFGESDWYWGFAMGVVSGLEADYAHSRTSEAFLTGNRFDKHIYSSSIEFVPTIAYKPMEKLSLGISPVAVYSQLRTDLIASLSPALETKGMDDDSYIWGVGVNAGAIYDVTDRFSIGLAYKSMRWNQNNKKYNDVLKSVNGAPEYIVGAALKLGDKFIMEGNVKYIHWKYVNIFKHQPEHGGYGWEDQWVFGLGMQYEALDNLRIRLGYNYGESPIKEDVMYANLLFAVISEHHIGAGFGYDITDNFTVDFGYVFSPENQITDNGKGDVYSSMGSGGKAKLTVHSIIIGGSYKFE